MVNPELQIELRAVLSKVVKEYESLRSQIKKFKLFGLEYFVRIIAKPLMYNNQEQDLFMVVFEKLDINEFVQKGNFEDPITLTDSRIHELETELNSTKEHLQTYIEEIETSNEELQSLNEEMQSTNEELQSSNEEFETTNEKLESTYEEIQIAHTKLKSSHDELAKKDIALLKTEANTRSLLNNNLQAFLLIDKKFKILDFNVKAQKLLSDISHKQVENGIAITKYLPAEDVKNYIQQFKKVLDNENIELSFDKQVKSINGQVYWLRVNINAINAATEQIEKLTIGILDITEQKKA